MPDSPNCQRHHSRELAMQALYQWSLSATPLAELRKTFRAQAAEQDKQPDWKYFDELLGGVLRQKDKLDQRISEQSNIDFERLSLVELAILRLGAYELTQVDGTPPLVVIAEAVEISKKYGADGSYKFINAILDKLWTKPSC